MHFSKKGTTLVEMLVVIGLIAAFALVAALGLLGRKGQNDLNNTTQTMAALLREAQSRAMAQTSSTGWGVHFENSTTTAPFYAIFASTTYSSGAIQAYYRLPPGIGYLTSTVATGTSVNITFAQVTGLASASTSISIYASESPGNSSIISVASSGAVSF